MTVSDCQLFAEKMAFLSEIPSFFFEGGWLLKFSSFHEMFMTIDGNCFLNGLPW